MNDNQAVTVRIVGDASGVQPAVEQAGGSIAGLEPILAQLNEQLAAMTAMMGEAFAQGGVGAEKMAAGMHVARAATEEENNALTRMVMKVHEGAESIRTFQMRAKAFAEVYVGIFAVEAISRWAEGLAEAAEKVEHLSAKLGMSVPEVQALSGAATMSGTNIDVLAKAIGMMDNRAVVAAGHTSSAGKAFKAMGIDANDGSTNMERLLKIADQFHGMADGPTKAALAMQLFSRSGRDMIPFLNQGSAAIQQLMEKSKELGAVNEAAIEQGARVASSVNEAKVAFAGLKNIIMEGFGPTLTEIVDGFIALVEAMKQSYDSGGLVKVIFETIGVIVSGLIEIFHAVGETMGELFNSTGSGAAVWSAVIRDAVFAIVTVLKLILITIVGVKDGVLAAWDLMKAAAFNAAANFREAVGDFQITGVALGEFMKVVGKICEDALHLHWGSIAADWDAGMANVRNAVQAKSNEILAVTGHLRQQAQADLAAAAGMGTQFGDFFKKMAADSYKPAHDDFKFKFGGGGGDAPDITNPEKGKKGKEGPSIAERLEAELEQKKTAWAMEQDAQGTFQQYSLQAEADYWSAALKRSDLGTKDKLAVEKKYLAARQALKEDEIAQELDKSREQLEIAGQNWTKKRLILEQEAAYVTRMYGAQSKEARQANEAVVKAKRDEAQQLRDIDQLIAERADQRKFAAIDAAQAAAEAEVAMGRLSKTQLLALERQYEDQRYQIERAALQRRIELMKLDPGMDPAKLQQIYTQLEALERAHQARLTQIQRQAEQQRTQIQRNSIRQASQGWASAIAQMITLQKGFASTITSLWQTVQQTIASAIESILGNWLEKQLTALILGKSQKIAEGAGEIAANAAVAASGAYAATAAIPVVGPAMAPAAAATAYAGAMSWMGALTAGAAEKGDWNVREGLYHLHEREMVLPSWAAEPLRNMIASRGAANGNAPIAANEGGNPHLHLHSVMPPKPRELMRFFKGNSQALGHAVRHYVRNGGAAAFGAGG
jgi:hypothetical protein